VILILSIALKQILTLQNNQLKSKSLEDDQLETVKSHLNEIIINDRPEFNESSYLLSTPDSINLNFESNHSSNKFKNKLAANQIKMDDLEFDLKSESDKDNESKAKFFDHNEDEELLKTSELLSMFTLDKSEEPKNSNINKLAPDDDILLDNYYQK